MKPELELLKKISEDVEFIKKVLSESEFGDFFLTSEEEKEVEETLRQKEKGELLNLEETFGE